MGKLEEAKRFLKAIGMPGRQQTDLCGYVLLAMAHIKETDSWQSASNDWIRIHDIIQFVGEHYGVIYAEDSLKRRSLYGTKVKNRKSACNPHQYMVQ